MLELSGLNCCVHVIPIELCFVSFSNVMSHFIQLLLHALVNDHLLGTDATRCIRSCLYCARTAHQAHGAAVAAAAADDDDDASCALPLPADLSQAAESMGELIVSFYSFI